MPDQSALSNPKQLLFAVLVLTLSFGSTKGFSQIAEVRKLESILPKVKDSIRYVDVLNRIGMLSHLQYRDSCLYYAQKAEGIALRHNYDKGVSDALNCQGIYYIAINNYLSAKYFNDALQIYQKMDDLEGICLVKMNMATLISVNKSGGNALQYIQEAYEKSKSLKKDSIRSILISKYLNIDTSVSKSRFKALFDEGYAIAKKYQDHRMIIFYNATAGVTLYEEGQKQAGLDTLLKALKQADLMGFESVKVWTYAALSDMMLDQKKDQLGINYLTNGLEASEEFGYAEFYTTFAEKLYRYYKSHDQPEKAYYYVSLLLAKRDQIAKAADQSGYNYLNFALRENENIELKDKADSRFRMIALLACLFALSVALLFFVYRSLRVKKEHAEAQRKLHELTLRQNTALQQTNHFNTMLISVIAHDVRQPFSTVVMLSSIFNEEVDLLGEAEKLEIMRELNGTAQKSLSFMDGLLEWIKSKKNGFEYHPDKLMLKALIYEANTFFQMVQEKKMIRLELDVEEEVSVCAHKQMLLFILRNMLNNATKFSPVGGRITVALELKADEIILSINDQGVGMSQEKIDHLFTLAACDGEENQNHGAGLALSISYEMASIMNAKIYARSALGAGTTFFLALKRND
ncbi:HAMP domain-containing histidine kinase [Pedobacter sp. N36a]|uniref:sensor histidine kinase n=1 Tax=Pedobacter sp. N36a TaxID=2767996 RepID=UPI0016572B24|nr:HAMP domain-containing sensor histidine kinase [Pedobacter sp. N36a]MBC8987967.1 HAMP domain-containing histidine kinase [Pedobacter sp. N36a]